MNLTHLIALAECLESAEHRYKFYTGEETVKMMEPIVDWLRGHHNGFAHKKEINLRARVRLLLAIERELLVLRTQVKLELAELQAPDPSSQDLAVTSSGAGSVDSVFDNVLAELQTVPGSGYNTTRT